MKFMEVNEGKIQIAGYDIKDIDIDYLRQHISYIPQNIEMFTGTIIENLKIGNPDAKYEEILNACKISGADSFIERLPGRYGAFIEEGGSNLSGGEKQRLAIARALIANPDLYIFDEATSNLDSFSERKLQELIFHKIKNVTTIIIAHRLSTIRQCDLICFLENGKITEMGTHEELMKLKGKYENMIRLQNVHIEKIEEKEVDEEVIQYA